MTGRASRLPTMLAVLALGGCGADVPPAVRISITNSSGDALAAIRLSWSSGNASFGSIPAGHTQSTFAEVTSDQPLRLGYVDAAGRQMDLDLDRPLTPGLIGGGYHIRIKPGGTISLWADWP